MKNSLRLGGMVAILAMTGATAVVRDSEADPSGLVNAHRRQMGLTSPSAVQDSVRGGLNPYMPPIDAPNLLQLAYVPGAPIPTTYGYELNLIDNLKTLTSENVDLQNKLDATRAQIEELLMRLEVTETTCEDATSENGCPAGCERKRVCIGDGPGADFWGPE